MTLYATERIDDAVSLVRSLLLPFDAGLWARLAVVVFFLGIGSGSGGGNVSSSVTNVPSTASSASGTGISFDPTSISIPPGVLQAIAVVVAVLVVVGLVFAWLGATMEFVFVEALADQSVSLRRGVRRHAGRGLRLFGFRLVLFVIPTAIVGGAALALFWGPITTLVSGGTPTVGEGRLLAGIAVLVLLGVFVGAITLVIHGLTTEFVVPIMLLEERGVLSGWGRLWPTIKAQWKQYLAYLLVSIGLHIVTTIAAGIVVGIAAVVVAIPFVIVGLALGFGAIASGTVTTSLVVGIGLLVVVFGFVVAVVGAIVNVPVQSFHRYFGLLVLGDIEPEFDVLGDLRPALKDGFESPSAD